MAVVRDGGAASVCEKHEGRPIEYFCEDDQTAICSHCVIVGEHHDHTIVAMEEKVVAPRRDFSFVYFAPVYLTKYAGNVDDVPAGLQTQ